MDFISCTKVLLISSFMLLIGAVYHPSEEIQKLSRRLYSTHDQIGDKNYDYKKYILKDIPDSIDWRKRGFVTPVQNQGQCGSSSIFSALGSLEGQVMRKKGVLIDLSSQQLMECCGQSEECSCSGAFNPASFFKCVQQMGGIDDAHCYPNDDKCGKCKFNDSCVVAKCKGVVSLPKGNETVLKIAVATIGPISVVVDASSALFQMYSGGVYDDAECSSLALDHSMLIVGYGTSNGQKYWIVKNSWGEQWGISGYIYMSREKNNQCGIATMASYPIL